MRLPSTECPDCDGTFGDQNPNCWVGIDIAKTVDKDRAFLLENPDVNAYTRSPSFGEQVELEATRAILPRNSDGPAYEDDSVPGWPWLYEECSRRDLIATVVRDGDTFKRIFGWRYSE